PTPVARGRPCSAGGMPRAQLARRLPDATWLRLSLATRTAGRSRGATLSTAAALVAGGRDIHQGVLRKRTIAFSTSRVSRDDAHGLTFAAAPLAELLAVRRSTGVLNIVAGIALSRVAAAVLRIGGPWIGRLLQRRAARAPRGPEPGPREAAVTAV